MLSPVIRRISNGNLGPLALSLLFSGAAALVYQVVWVRHLTTVLGTTLEAVAAVLSVFMLGLGLGGALAARFLDRMPSARLPRAYAALEIGIAAFALSFPSLIAFFPPPLRFAPAILLVLPATLMGATLPTAVAIYERSRRDGVSTGRSAGLLYAFNTGGAVAGSLATALFLLPSVGMRVTTIGAASLNVLAAAIVVLGIRGVVEVGEPERPRPRFSHGSRIAFAVVTLSGFAALVSEVAWTRSLVLLIGPTTYGFSFVVSSVIFGIALGSAAGARWVRREGTRSLAWAQLGASVASLALVQILGRLSLPIGNLVHRYSDDMTTLLGIELAAVAALLFLPSFFFGATFPLAVGVVSREGAGPAESTGATLAWNTAGALSGSLGAGFLLIPHLGAEGALYTAFGIHLVAAGISSTTMPLVPALSLALAVAIPLVLPRWDREFLTGGLYKYASYLEPGELLDFVRQGEILFYREDEVATVTVRRVASRLSLAIDGKVDATSSADMMTQRLLAHVPLLLHPAPKDVLVIGLGSGVTAGSALSHPIEDLEAVEISPAVVSASRLFDDVSHRPSADPRFHLVVGDGRNHLLVSPRPYDVIISEPSNPWMAGVSGLFTREFFELARSRLAPGGLFCQWAHIYNMSGSDLSTIVATFTDAFDSAALFLLSESDILLLGAKERLPRVGSAELEERMGRGRVREDLLEVGVRGSYGIRALLAASTPPLSAWARDADRHTDDCPLLEFRAAKTLHRDTSRENRRTLEHIGVGDDVLERVEPSPADLPARGEALERAESFEWAFETFVEAVEREPRSQEALEGLVRTALRAGGSDAAETTLKRVASESDAIEPVLSLALLYRRLGRFDDALGPLARALELAPGNREALLLAAEVSGDRGDAAAMARYAGLLLQQDALDPEAGALHSEARLRAGDLEGASRESASILARHADPVRALQVHAVAHAELGNRNLARESFEKLLEIEPEAWIQLNNLGRLELDSGNGARAAELFERAVDLNSRNLEGYRGLEEASAKIGDATRLERARSMVRFLSK
jgi:spermidine synthase